MTVNGLEMVILLKKPHIDGKGLRVSVESVFPQDGHPFVSLRKTHGGRETMVFLWEIRVN